MGHSPYRRLRELASVNQSEMARRADVTRQTIATLELGMYETVPEKANRALAESCRNAGVDAITFLEREYGVANLNAAMDGWKTEKRQEQDLSDWDAMSLKLMVGYFETVRQFCDVFCIPTYALYNALHRGMKPPVIGQALSEAGYAHVDAL